MRCSRDQQKRHSILAKLIEIFNLPVILIKYTIELNCMCDFFFVGCYTESLFSRIEKIINFCYIE